MNKVRREMIADGKLPHKHSFKDRGAAVRLASAERKAGRRVKVTQRGLLRKKFTVQVG